MSVLQSFSQWLDNFVFVKRAYSIWLHLIPFSIASLIIVTVSVSPNDILPKLVKELNKGSWTLLPAIVLTVVTAVIYFGQVFGQIKRLYLWPKHHLRRTVVTVIVYVTLCTLMALVVLSSTTDCLSNITPGSIWACLLVAFLSLTGIGWKGPTAWARDADLKFPDYGTAHRTVDRISEILSAIRANKYDDRNNKEKLILAVNSLYNEIEQNLRYEAEWEKDRLKKAQNDLNAFAKHLKQDFDKVADLSNALRYERLSRFRDFILCLQALVSYWPIWGYQKKEVGDGF